MNEYIDLKEYFNSIRKKFVNEELLLKENEKDAFHHYYGCIAALWDGEVLDDSESNEFLFVEDLYGNYCKKIQYLYADDYKKGAEINVWSISGLKDDEVRNTSTLGWWLDKSETHGFGSELLKQVFKDHINPKDTCTLSACHDKKYRVRCESLPLRELENRIDIEIISDSFLMFWEVKINAPEGKNGQQLTIYAQLLERKANIIAANQSSYLIYLTKEKKNLEHLGDNVYPLTWNEVRQSFLKVHKRLKLDESCQLPSKLLYQYCQFIERFN